MYYLLEKSCKFTWNPYISVHTKKNSYNPYIFRHFFGNPYISVHFRTSIHSGHPAVSYLRESTISDLESPSNFQVKEKKIIQIGP